jgi:S1-C subfamily serine protease
VVHLAHNSAMRKRVYIALAVLLVMLASVAAWQVLRERKPVYQGKWLSVWLKNIDSSPAQERVTGVGLALGVEADTITIMKVLPNTPASKAGLVPGLVIRTIDGTATDGKLLKECVDMLRGGVGTKVKLELVDTANSKTNTVELTRERIL